jgi:DNA-binding NarL/FixJ family response regulator
MVPIHENDNLRPVILIVEDHDALRDSLKSWLGSVFQDCYILVARNGEDALNKVSFQPPDIVLMDVLLPGMNGIAAAKCLKDVIPNARVVMLSIYEDPAYQADAVAAGAYAYIPKRKMGKELIPMITKLLQDRLSHFIAHSERGES